MLILQLLEEKKDRKTTQNGREYTAQNTKGGITRSPIKPFSKLPKKKSVTIPNG